MIALPALLGPIFGPMLGGLIVDHGTWRWIFWVNIPLCLAGLVLAAQLMPAGSGNRTRRLDVLGLALLSPAIAILLYGFPRSASSVVSTARRSSRRSPPVSPCWRSS